MGYFSKNRPSPIIWALSLAGCVLSVGATRIGNFDIWWHLKTGEIITNWLSIPKHDIFSYTASGQSWMNHEWLSQVMVWNLYKHIGIESLTLLKFTIAIGIAYTIFKTIELLTRSQIAAAWGTLITLIALADRMLMRPFLFSMLFLPVFIEQLNLYTAGKRKNLWSLPLLTILWINIHGGGILAPQLILAFALGESMQAWASNRFNYKNALELDSKKRSHLWFVGVICIGTCMINPYGIEIITFPLRHLEMRSILTFTQEWLPILDARLDVVLSQILFRIVLILIPISYIVGRKSVRLSHLMLTILSSLLIFKGRRFAADFVLINIPIIFVNFRDTVSHIQLSYDRINLRAWINLFAISIISLLLLEFGVPSTIRGGTVGELGFRSTKKFAPINMIRFLENNDIHGRVFNEMGLGGFLIFSRWPGETVFVDGRTPVYGDDFYLNYVNAIRHEKFFEELNEKYDFDYLVFKWDQLWNMRFFHKYLWDNPKWQLVYANRDGFVYLKNNQKFSDLINKYRLNENPLIEEMKRSNELDEDGNITTPK